VGEPVFVDEAPDRAAVTAACSASVRSIIGMAKRTSYLHLRMTARTPLARRLASVIGGPGLLRMVQAASRRIARARF
jgi:hypothetical protein